jgi:hypothetical protein
MPKTLPLKICFVLLIALLAGTRARAEQSLVSNQAASQLGLQRAWFAQARVDPSRDHVVQWLLDQDQLLALMSDGTVQALDASTGQTLWTTELGLLGGAPLSGIAANSKYLALLGTARLYLLDRTDGHQLWSRRTYGASTTAPALSQKFAYVALMNGRVEGYPLQDPTGPVWHFQSLGHLSQSPTTTDQSVSWASDSGFLYVARPNSHRMQFQINTHRKIVSPPAQRGSLLYTGSLDGYLHCFDAQSGSIRWRYAADFAIVRSPVIVGDQVYVASQAPALHAVHAQTGEPLWQVHGVRQFVAQGKRQTYGIDGDGTLIAVENATGGVVGQLQTRSDNRALANAQSDRIYLVNDRGLVQCLHEIGSDQPLWHRDPSGHRDPSAEDAENSETTPATNPPATVASDQNPFSPFQADDNGADDNGADDNGSDDDGTNNNAADNNDDPADDDNPFAF